MTNASSLPSFIELETSRFCNRRCEWCPNGSFISRRQQELMAWETFSKIVCELARLQYRGWIALHNFNEPLANPRLIEELQLIADELPDARSSVFSNGDLLKPHSLEALISVRTRYLRITRYPSRSKAHVTPSADRLFKWLERSGLAALAEWRLASLPQGIAVHASLSGLDVQVIAPEISTYNSRGGTTPMNLAIARRTPCALTTHSAAIDYRGRMKMCCNVFSDAPSHAKYVLGSLATTSFEELWDSTRMRDLRKQHLRADWSASRICETCQHDAARQSERPS